MRPHTRAAGLVAGVSICAMVLTAALNSSGHPAATSFATPGVPTPTLRPATSAPSPATVTASGTPVTVTEVSRAVTEPPAGSLRADQAIAELQQAELPPLTDAARPGLIGAITAQPGTTLTTPPGGVDAFAKRYAGAFGLVKGYHLRRSRTAALPGGDTVVRYQQTAGDVPVLGAEMLVTVDTAGQVRAASSSAIPVAPVSTTPSVTADAAARTAVTHAAEKFDVAAPGLTATAPALWLYAPELIGAPGPATPFPTWRTVVNGPDGHRFAEVLVDARDGTVALAVSARHEGRDRLVCDLNGVENTREYNLDDPGTYACWPGSTLSRAAAARSETGATSSVSEVNKAFDVLGKAYDFYWTKFGRDSYDGRGARIQATVRVCQSDVIDGDTRYDYYCPYRNAFWDGKQLAFGQGWAVDDLTGHELTHAVIDHASQLYYAYEPGALNEALADIMGEFIDQTYAMPGENTTTLWTIGEDLPAVTGTLRSMAHPHLYDQPDSVAGGHWYSGEEDNGGVHTNSGVANRVAYLIAQGDGTYPGIGLEKSIQLWYRVMHGLTSGSTYRELGRVLSSTCAQLAGNFGFTRDDCRVIDNLPFTVNMRYLPGTDSFCGGYRDGHMFLTTPVFTDDMESDRRWSFNNAAWIYLPDPAVNVRYARSGERSLYGFRGTLGSSYVTMKSSVVVPAAGPDQVPYLFYFRNAVQSTSALFKTGPLVEYDDGTGWQPVPNSQGTLGMTSFHPVSVDLTPLAGKTVRFRFALTSAVPNLDWIIDDVSVATCKLSPKPPMSPFAVKTGATTANVSWYGSETYPGDYFELTYDPPIPGAPARLAPSLESSNDFFLWDLDLTGLAAGQDYQISIVYVDVRAGGQRSPASTVVLYSKLPPVCATTPGGARVPNAHTRTYSRGECPPGPGPRRQR